MQFDWRTDEEDSWTPQPEPPPRRSPNRRRRLLVGLVALAAVILGVVYLYRQAQERIAATEEAVAEDVLASHELAATAARTGDAEMLRNVLSGADDDWAAAQLRRVAGGPHAGRRAFGFEPLEESGLPPTVELNPEMRAAELAWVARYSVAAPSGLVSTVALTQTAVYRRGSNNWLLAPPEAAFWQGSDEYRGAYVEAIFPGRDEAIATRLAAALDGVLVELCNTWCPAGFRLRLILSPDPASFANTEPRALLSAGRTLVLPAPTLVGLPVDDAAYAALERGYAVLVTTAVLADTAAYDCCHNALYTSAWVHWRQHQMGLRLWPLDVGAYERLLRELPDSGELTGFLGANPRLLPELSFEHWAPVYAFVQFLYEEYGPSGASSPLYAPPGNALAMLGIDREQWAAAFPRFVYEQSLSARLPGPPSPLPEADLALQCSREGVQVELRQLDLQDGAIRSLYENPDLADLNWPDYAWMEPLGAGQGLLLISRQRLTEGDGAGRFEFSLLLLRDGQSVTLFRTLSATWDELPALTPERSDPSGRYLVLGDYSPGRGASPTQFRYVLADLESCDGDSCELHEITGSVLWSPDGNWTLVAGDLPQTNAGLQLYEGDAAAGNLRPVGWGHTAVWLDDSHYAYTVLPPEEPELVVRAAGQEAELLRVPLADVWTLAGVGHARPLNTTTLDYTLITRPHDPTRLLLRADLGLGTHGESLLFLLQLSQDLRSLESSAVVAANAVEYAFSATGRWLAVTRSGPGEFERTLFDFTSLEEGMARERVAMPNGSISWAPEGDWLAARGEGYVLLFNPTAGYTHFVPVDTRECAAYAWVETP